MRSRVRVEALHAKWLGQITRATPIRRARWLFLAIGAMLILGGGVMTAAAVESSSPVELEAAKVANIPPTPQPNLVTVTPEEEAAANALDARARATGAYNVHGTDHGLEMDFASDQKPVSIPGVTTVVLSAPAARYDAADAYARSAVGAGHSFANILMNGKWQLSTNAPASVKADIQAKYGDVVNVLDSDGPRALSSAGRRDADVAPFWSGDKANKSGGGFCTGGFIVTSGSPIWQLTAGHCGPIGTVFTYANGFQWSQVVNNRAPALNANCGSPSVACGQWDDAILNTSPQYQFNGHMWSGPTNGTAFVTQAAGAGNCANGLTYYTSSAASGMTAHYAVDCDHAAIVCEGTDLGASWCYAHLSLVGTSPIPGDSGSPLVAWAGGNANAAMRGTLIAGDSFYGYVEPWTRISATWGGVVPQVGP